MVQASSAIYQHPSPVVFKTPIRQGGALQRDAAQGFDGIDV